MLGITGKMTINAALPLEAARPASRCRFYSRRRFAVIVYCVTSHKIGQSAAELLPFNPFHCRRRPSLNLVENEFGPFGSLVTIFIPKHQIRFIWLSTADIWPRSEVILSFTPGGGCNMIKRPPPGTHSAPARRISAT